MKGCIIAIVLTGVRQPARACRVVLKMRANFSPICPIVGNNGYNIAFADWGNSESGGGMNFVSTELSPSMEANFGIKGYF